MITFNSMMGGGFALVATFVTVAAATPLRAETMSVPVAYGDIDIGQPSGAAVLDARIRRAARLACGPEDVGNRIAIARCRADAVESAYVRLAAKAVGANPRLAAR